MDRSLKVDQLAISPGVKSSGTPASSTSGTCPPLNQPASRLRERDGHEPAAALSRAARQRNQRTECHQVAGDVVDRGDGIELWTRLHAGE